MRTPSSIVDAFLGACGTLIGIFLFGSILTGVVFDGPNALAILGTIMLSIVMAIVVFVRLYRTR
jgi:hypothetical protein